MYYSHGCSYCTKIFFTFNSNKELAARTLFEGIKKHLIDYDEDHKEFEFDEEVSIEYDQMYKAMNESNDKPAGGYEL